MSEFPVAGGFHPDDEPATEAEVNLGVLEYLADFQSVNPLLDDGISLRRRPDAISLDYLTCFTLGPVNLADFSQGPVDRPWRVRAVGNRVYYARLNNARTGFDPEQFLFSFSGPTPIEIDAAFDQAARIFVCMERPTGTGETSELWVYYFDPFLGDFTLTNFGKGRTPRAALDDAVDTNNADILVFYLNDTLGMCYRMQRERYQVERIVTGTIPTAVDTSQLNMIGPVAWNFPGPKTGPVTPTYLGYKFAQYTGGGVRALLFSYIDITPGLYNPIPAVRFRGQFVPDAPIDPDPPVPKYGGLLNVVFDKPVNGIDIEMLDSQYDGAKVIAYDKDWHELGSVTFVKTVGGAPQVGQIFKQGIRTLQLLAPAADTTNWRNLRFTTDPLPPIPGADIWPPIENIFLEDVYKGTSNRMVMLYSIRDPVTGTYTLHQKASVLYPFKMDVENWTLGAKPNSGVVPRVLLYAVLPGQLNPVGDPPEGFTEQDLWKLGAVPQPGGTLISIIIFHTLFDKDEWKFGSAGPQSGSVPVVLFFHTLYDKDEWKFGSAGPQSGSVPVVLFLHTLYDIDQWQLGAFPQSGSLV